MAERMEYRGYLVQHSDDRKRSFSIFNETAVECAWVCSTWQHPQLGLQVVVNHPALRTLTNARAWIDAWLNNDRTVIKEGEQVIFAKTRDEAESGMRTREASGAEENHDD